MRWVGCLCPLCCLGAGSWLPYNSWLYSRSELSGGSIAKAPRAAASVQNWGRRRGQDRAPAWEVWERENVRLADPPRLG